MERTVCGILRRVPAPNLGTISRSSYMSYWDIEIVLRRLKFQIIGKTRQIGNKVFPRSK